MRKTSWLLAGVVPMAVFGWALLRERPASPPAEAAPATSVAPPVRMDPNDEGHDDDRSYVFRVPSGEPTALSCAEAKLIVEQVRAGLAYPPGPVPPTPFATSASDWLDPHGLLSLAKDAPTEQALVKVAPDLLADLENRRSRGCASAAGPAAALEGWAADLRKAFDEGRRVHDGRDARAAAMDPLPAAGVARDLALEIGRRAGAFESAIGSPGVTYADVARKRFFPPLDREGWSRVVLAAAVRAYVPLLDPHGEWSPFDEESRIYEVDLASRPPGRLWGRAIPTAVGVRIGESATAPLVIDDVVLSLANVPTAGLPLEQIDQLGFATADAKLPVPAIVYRQGKLLTLELGRQEDGGVAALRGPGGELPSERMPFGEGDVLVVGVKDVKDDLGEELAAKITSEREHGARKLVGVVIDLRGNGGGSTDGALGALSLFLPGAPLFAMKRRDGTIEIDRAPMARDRERWTGPVATFVDGMTASAAEMIAGALAAYRRGPTVGTATFGKGCAQEYIDDDAHAGVLRLTTLVYALPDGSPVQRVGLVPQIRFPFVASADGGPHDREAKLPHSAPPWRGPDLRDPAMVKPEESAWPAHGGAVGPCHDADTCKALRLLAGPRRAPVAKH